MKKIVILSFSILSILVASAQGPLQYEASQFNLSSGYTTTGIPVFLSYEFGIADDFSFGAEGSYRIYQETLNSVDFDHGIMGFRFFGNYHFNTMLSLPENLNLYAGLNTGFYKWFSEEGYLEFAEERNSSTMGVGAQLGFRYYFKDFGVYVEGNGGTEIIGGRLGLTYRID